jgi:hypothetical protein
MPKVSFRMASASRESVFGAQTNTARTDTQDLTAQRDALTALGVKPNRIYADKGLTGTNRARPGLREALAIQDLQRRPHHGYRKYVLEQPQCPGPHGLGGPNGMAN